MIQTGSIEPIQFDGAVQPKTDQFIRSSEYTASTVKICWNSDQNTAFATNNGMKARTRDRSTGATRELVSIVVKYAADATAMTPVVTCDRFDSLTTPLSSAAAITAPPATTMPITSLIALLGNGFGTSRP